MKQTYTLDHPLASELLGVLRNSQTGIKQFRRASDKLTALLLIEATKNLPIHSQRIQTPLEETDALEISEPIVFLPILRAGLVFVPQGLSLFPSAGVGMVGLKRDEVTAVAHEYFSSLPSLKGAHVLVLDPMLATGGSALHVLRLLENEKAASVRLVTVIAAPEGIEAVHKEFTIDIFTTAIDEGLNNQKYIVPGLGDFGDRYFGTT